MATPLRARSTAKWCWLQTKIPPRAPVRITGTGRIQNGLGMKSRLHVKWASTWTCHGLLVEVGSPT